MLNSWFAWIALGIAVVLAVVHRRDRTAARKLAAEQREVLGQILEEVFSLREALVTSGAAKRLPRLLPVASV